MTFLSNTTVGFEVHCQACFEGCAALRMDSSHPNVVEPFVYNIFKRVSKWKGKMWNVCMGSIVFENVPFNWEEVKNELFVQLIAFILYLYYDLRMQFFTSRPNNYACLK